MTQTYTPGLEVSGEQWLKLHRNENLFIEKKWLEEIGATALYSINLSQYPDPGCIRLRKRLGQLYNIEPACIFVGNGSDEILSTLLRHLRAKYSKVVTQKITYRVYPLLLQRYGYKQLTLESASKNHLCLIDSPNSLTGEISEVLNIPSSFLIWDNVYGEFANEQLHLNQINQSTVIIRSFSKFYGLASLRIGYCFANEKIVEELMLQKDIYNVNAFAQEVALRVLDYKGIFDSLIPKITKAREELQAGLKALGFVTSNSKTNSIWITHPIISAKKLQQHIEKYYIITRIFLEPDLYNYLRITVPPLEEVYYLLEVIKKYV